MWASGCKYVTSFFMCQPFSAAVRQTPRAPPQWPAISQYGNQTIQSERGAGAGKIRALRAFPQVAVARATEGVPFEGGLQAAPS